MVVALKTIVLRTEKRNHDRTTKRPKNQNHKKVNRIRNSTLDTRKSEIENRNLRQRNIEVGNRKAEVGGQKSVDGGQRSEVVFGTRDSELGTREFGSTKNRKTEKPKDRNHAFRTTKNQKPNNKITKVFVKFLTFRIPHTDP